MVLDLGIMGAAARAALEEQVRRFFADQWEAQAPILTLGALVCFGVGLYDAVRGIGHLAAGGLVVGLICASQAVVGWRRRRARGDDKWRPM
jgi:hypothetical protein